MNVTGNISAGIPKISSRPPMGGWVARAACRGQDPNLCFREERGGAYLEARAVCATCPVRPECLAWAVETNTEHGLFGGLTPRERQPFRANQSRHRSVVCHG